MMSNYKVGDLASLMSPSSKKKSGSKLQSLFNEHWNKRQSPNAVKNTKGQLKNAASGCDIESNTSTKIKKKKVLENTSTIGSQKKEMKIDLNSDFLPLHDKKKPFKKDNSNLVKKRKNSFPEDSVIENKIQKVEHSENAKAFIRCAKNKSKKTYELESDDASTTEPVHAKESLFSEFADSENTSNYQSKKQKTKKKKNQSLKISLSPSSSVDTKEPEVAENVVVEDKVNAEKIRLESIQDLPCTLFVGNLPVSINRKKLYKLFSSFGQIKSVRLRGAVSTKMSIPKKVAEIKSEYHKGLTSHTGFVVFKDEASAKSALTLNGTLIDSHHILVDFASQAGEKKLYNNDLSIFLGNLPFDVDDETVRSAFEECGEIHAVRIIRDKNTRLGKGFGYVQFQKIKAKEKALTLDDVEINGRKIRIKPIDQNQGNKAGPKKTLMMIRNNMAMKRTKESGNKKSVKKLLKKGKHIHKKKQIARLLGQKFVK